MCAALRNRFLVWPSLCALLLLNACGGGGGGGGGAGGGGATVPVAPQADLFDWIGNTPLTVAAPSGLLANDPLGTIIAAADSTTTGGGTVDVNLTNGAFTYHPPVGLQNDSDTFTYTVGGFAPTTVTINLGERIWYVDNARPANGDGTLGNPFNTLRSAEAPVSDENDTIFVFTGDPVSPNDDGQDRGITLVAGQKLRGQGLGLRFKGLPLAAALPNPPVISNAGLGEPDNIPVVRLATGNEVAGFTIQADFNEGILALGGGGHNLHDNIIIVAPDTGREGIRLLNIEGENFVIFNTITGALGAREGILLANDELQDETIVDPTPITATVTMSRNTIDNAPRDGIRVRLNGTGTGAGTNVKLNILTNTIANAGADQANQGIDIVSSGDATVTAVISRNTVRDSNQEAMDLSNEGTLGFAAFVANNNLSGSGAPADFSAAIANAGATFCLELINNFNAGLNSTFLVANNGDVAGDFRFFEVDNDAPADPVGPITPVAEGACNIPLDGAALFVANCAKCHTGNGLGLTTVRQFDAGNITNASVAAINLQFSNNAFMIQEFSPTGRLQLTQQEIAAIAAALALVP